MGWQRRLAVEQTLAKVGLNVGTTGFMRKLKSDAKGGYSAAFTAEVVTAEVSETYVFTVGITP